MLANSRQLRLSGLSTIERDLRIDTASDHAVVTLSIRPLRYLEDTESLQETMSPSQKKTISRPGGLSS